MVAALLAQVAGGAYQWRAFLDPLPVWNVWYLLLVPLCAGVAVVWKSIKCETVARIPGQAAQLLFWILFTMVAAGAGLAGVVRALEWWQS
jgi:hypothetical protein